MRKSSETVTKYDFRILIRTEMYFVRFRTTFSASRSVGRTVLYGSMQHFLLLDPSEGRFCTVPDTVFCFRIRQKSAIHLFCTVPDCSFCFRIRQKDTIHLFCTVPDSSFCFWIRQKSAIHLFCTVPDAVFCFWIRREDTLQHFYSEDTRSLRLFPACTPHSQNLQPARRHQNRSSCAPCGLSPQTGGMPVIPTKQPPRKAGAADYEGEIVL